MNQIALENWTWLNQNLWRLNFSRRELILKNIYVYNYFLIFMFTNLSLIPIYRVKKEKERLKWIKWF